MRAEVNETFATQPQSAHCISERSRRSLVLQVYKHLTPHGVKTEALCAGDYRVAQRCSFPSPFPNGLLIV